MITDTNEDTQMPARYILPIDLIPNTDPPRFRWQQVMTLPGGGRVVQECDGTLPPSVEGAVKQLIGMTLKLACENADLKVGMLEMTNRIDSLTDKLKAAQEAQSPPPQPAPTKKGKVAT